MFFVVPFAGTWIEICGRKAVIISGKVVPFAGTWIEILPVRIKRGYLESFPSRERGLKLNVPCNAILSALSFPSRERGLKLSCSG